MTDDAAGERAKCPTARAIYGARLSWQLVAACRVHRSCRSLQSPNFGLQSFQSPLILQGPCLAESTALRIRNLQRSIAFKAHRSCSGRPNSANIHLVHQWTPRHHIVCLVNSLGCLKWICSSEYVQANMLKTSRFKTSRLPWIRSNGFKRVCSFRMCSREYVESSNESAQSSRSEFHAF